ncbi:MAG TPA: hypothetical protein VF510_02690 [Ktedonobacterales bacterium]
MKPEDLRRVSVQEWLERNIQRPRVREFMAAQARTLVYSSALELVSADVFILKTQLALNNPALYIDGGWQALVDGLRSAAEQAGARIVAGTRVEVLRLHFSVLPARGHENFPVSLFVGVPFTRSYQTQ